MPVLNKFGGGKLAGSKTKSGLYICLEGLDGTGKSTAFSYISDRLNELGIHYATIAPTKAGDANALIERIFKRYPILDHSRFLRQFKFAARSNLAARNVDWQKKLILGDRSIITSYIAHFGKNPIANKLITVVINFMEREIYAPDYVIYLYVNDEAILRSRLNIRDRAKDIDETDLRRKQMRLHYEQIKKNAPKRVSHTIWLTIPAETSPDDVGSKIFSLILQLLRARELQEDKNQ